MIFAVLTCISIIVLACSWFLYRRNMELFLCVLIAISSEFFYLLPQFVGFKYLLLPILAILLFESFLTRKLSMGRYGWWVLCFIGISCLGVIVAYFSGQSLELGIKAAKFVPFMLIYFLVVGRKIDVDKFCSYFTVMAIVIGIIATAQYFLPGNVVIFSGMPDAMKEARLENPRVTIAQFVISAAAVIAFSQYIRNRKSLYLVSSIALFLEIIFIQKTRVMIAGVFLSMFLIYILSTKLTMLRLAVYLILSGMIMGVFLFASAQLSEIEVVKRTGVDIVKKKGSFQGRINAYKYYFQEIQKRPLLGHGMLNFNWDGNQEKYLQEEKGIHLSDIGIIHIFFQAGIIGLLWFLYGLLKMWGDILHRRVSIAISSYLILATITMPTIDMFLRTDSMFLFATFLGILATASVSTRMPAPQPKAA